MDARWVDVDRRRVVASYEDEAASIAARTSSIAKTGKISVRVRPMSPPLRTASSIAWAFGASRRKKIVWAERLTHVPSIVTSRSEHAWTKASSAPPTSGPP